MNQAITVTEHEKAEWSRMAQAAYFADRNDIGHEFSTAASIVKGGALPLAKFDSLQRKYRAWLVFNDFPQA